jgi:outer membrane protein assembly factor BamB
MIEGEIEKGVPIILVDDLTNSGSSLIRQVEVVEALGHKVAAVWTVLRFRDPDQYAYFHEKKIPMHCVFTLDDFKDSLGLQNFKRNEIKQEAFTSIWKFSSESPSYHHVVPKSDPVIDSERVYVGSDNGTMWALSQDDGHVIWSYKIGLHAKGKGIFSSPALYDGTVYFGGYDGNFYALDAATGKKKWVALDADWIGSSPAIAPDLGLVFIGLEFGLWRKRGGIAAYDLKKGKKMWAYTDMPCYTHASPFYIREHQQVAVGSNDGVARLFDAKNGRLLWKFETGPVDKEELDSGFSKRDIKESFAYDAKRDLLMVGDMIGELCFLDRKSGKEVRRFKAEFGFYSTPLIVGNTVCASSLDKNLYCIDLDTFKEKWRWHAGTRIFASPTLINGNIFIGANSGRLTEIDPKTGTELSFVTLTERITSRPTYNKKTERFFVPTYANEIYCLKKQDT